MHAFFEPFNATFHGFNQREDVVRQAGSSYQSRESSTTAHISHGFISRATSGFAHIGHDGSGIKNMPFPNDIDIPWANQATGLTLVFKLGVKSFQLRQRLPQYFGKYR